MRKKYSLYPISKISVIVWFFLCHFYFIAASAASDEPTRIPRSGVPIAPKPLESKAPRLLATPWNDEKSPFSFKVLSPVSLDCVRFWMKASTDSLKVEQEFELTIHASYIEGLGAYHDMLAGCNNFSLKLLRPEGFVQTGGYAEEFLRAEVNLQNPTAEFKIRGKFTKAVENATFVLLRSHANADAQSLFIKKGELQLSTQCTLRAGDIKLTPI